MPTLYQKYCEEEAYHALLYAHTGTWHVDLCHCRSCRILQRWIYMPWPAQLWQRLVTWRQGGARKVHV